MNYQTALAMRDQREQAMKSCEKELAKFPRLPNGLTPDEYRDEHYRAVKRFCHAAFLDLQEINAYIVKNFKQEERARRNARRPKI